MTDVENINISVCSGTFQCPATPIDDSLTRTSFGKDKHLFSIGHTSQSSLGSLAIWSSTAWSVATRLDLAPVGQTTICAIITMRIIYTVQINPVLYTIRQGYAGVGAVKLPRCCSERHEPKRENSSECGLTHEAKRGYYYGMVGDSCTLRVCLLVVPLFRNTKICVFQFVLSIYPKFSMLFHCPKH